MPRSDLPFGSEFSPSQIELAEVLDFARTHCGDWKAFEIAVRTRYFDAHVTSDYNRGKLANNCKLGMIAYGIIDRTACLTEFGSQLWSLRAEPSELYSELAHHILLRFHGLTLVQTVLDIQTRGETVSLNKLRAWLEERGVHFPRGGKHPSSMRLWLERAGIFSRNSWDVNQARLEQILGADLATVDVLASLSSGQKAYVKTLGNLTGPGAHRSNEIEKLAEATYGVKFDEKNLPKSVLYPLEKAGYITLERGTKAPGRGAKPFLVRPTEKLQTQVILPLLEALERQVTPELRPLLRKSLVDILAQVESVDRYESGLALEALAFYLMRLVDLTYITTRLRGEATGGAEVDLIFEGARLLFSRWQIQCKNTTSVRLDDVAKEVGLSHVLKSNVIVVVSTGTIGPEARKYAQTVMRDTNLQIVLVDRADLLIVRDQPTRIVDVLNREAERAMTVKALNFE